MTAQPRTRVAVRGVVLHEGRMLLLRYQGKQAGEPIHYNLPGGSVGVAETVAEALHRKTLDSTGLAVIADRLLFVHETLPAGKGTDPSVHHKLEFIVLARPTGTLRAAAGDGQAEVVWWEPARLPAILLLPPLQERLLRALDDLCGCADPLFVDQRATAAEVIAPYRTVPARPAG